MKQNDFDNFCELLGTVSEQYGKPISEGAKILYWQGLHDFDFAVVEQALFRHIRNTDSGMFMPKIADIIKMLQGSTQDSALIAWAKVDKAVRLRGTAESVVFDDAIIHRVLSEMGGWLSLGQKTNDDWPFVAKEFETRYRGYKARGETPEYIPVMVGLYEAQNSVQGFKVAPPTLIGNKELAFQVMQNGTSKSQIGFTPAIEMLKNKHGSLVNINKNEKAA